MTGVALDRHLSVTVNAPSGLIVGQVDDASGQIALSVKETGKSLLEYLIRVLVYLLQLYEQIFKNVLFNSKLVSHVTCM